jgi:class 3 adenylate cyclase
MGDLEVVSLRPFGRAHMGVIGDSINLGSRLMSVAGPSEIIVSNTFYQNLDVRRQMQFESLQPVEARNVGRLQAWKLSCHST